MNKIIKFLIFKFSFFLLILFYPNFNNAKEMLIYADTINYDENENIVARGNAKIFQNKLIYQN